MGDQEKLDKIKNIYNASGFGLREIEQVLSLAEELDDRDNRDFYTAACVEWLAINGDLEHVEKMMDLANSIKSPFDKHSAYVAIASRFGRDGYESRAIKVLLVAEENIDELEKTNYVEWQQAQAWEEIADIYININQKTKSKQALYKAIKMAGLGQEGADPQNVKECSSILFAVTKRFMWLGYLEDALNTAQSIKMDSWRESALTELGKK